MKKKITIVSFSIIMFLFNMNTIYAAGFSSSGVISACGFDIPDRIPSFTSGLYNLVKIFIPIAIIIMGMIDFAKAVMANEEKKMNDSKKSFITRLLAGVIIFLIMAVVQFVFRQIETDDRNGFANCVSCLLSNNEDACKSGSRDIRKRCSDYDFRSCPSTDDFGDYCKSYTTNGSEGSCKAIITCEDFSVSQCDSAHAKRLACLKIDNKCTRECDTMGKDECLKHSNACFVGPNGQCKSK